LEKLLFGEVSCLRSRSKKKKIGSHAIIIIVVVASFFSLVAFDCFPLALSPIRSVRRRLRLECACRGQRERNKKPRRARSLAREKLAASSSSGRRNKEQAPRSPSPPIPSLSLALPGAKQRRPLPHPSGINTISSLTSSRCGPRPARAASAGSRCFPRDEDATTTTRRPTRRPRASTPRPCGRRRSPTRRRRPGRRRKTKRSACCASGGRGPRGAPWRGGRRRKRPWLQKKKKKRVERRLSGVNVLMNHTLALCLAFAKPSLHSLFLFTAGLPRKRRISLFFSTQGSLLHGSYRSPSEFDRALSGRAVKRARRKRARELSFD
jgi:hypothetical protein